MDLLDYRPVFEYCRLNQERLIIGFVFYQQCLGDREQHPIDNAASSAPVVISQRKRPKAAFRNDQGSIQTQSKHSCASSIQFTTPHRARISLEKKGPKADFKNYQAGIHTQSKHSFTCTYKQLHNCTCTCACARACSQVDI